MQQPLPKSLTGIRGLDEITEGGLPKGRPSLICGNAGCGKTILGMAFLLHGALDYNEPGVFVSLEETGDDLTSNFAARFTVFLPSPGMTKRCDRIFARPLNSIGCCMKRSPAGDPD